MDLTPLIFVALAVAWGVYLIPKAVENHESGSRKRSISTFSERIRVLARREASSRRRSTLVKAETKMAKAEASTSSVEAAQAKDHLLVTTFSGRLHLPQGGQVAKKPSTGTSAARRRRRVLGALVFIFAATGAIAAGQVISWLWLIAPGALVVGWLAACRLMVRKAHGAVRPAEVRRPNAAPSFAPVDIADTEATASIPMMTDSAIEVYEKESRTLTPVASSIEIDADEEDDEDDRPSTWEPVHAPLPTYVSKPSAPRRSVTIDLDSTGVWTSGRSELDSALAREAEAAQAAESPVRRVSGA